MCKDVLYGILTGGTEYRQGTSISSTSAGIEYCYLVQVRFLDYSTFVKDVLRTDDEDGFTPGLDKCQMPGFVDPYGVVRNW